MSQLGVAYVQIVPSAQGISGKIQKAINPEAKAAGISAGNTIGGGMKQRLSKVSQGLFRAGAIATAVSVPIIAGIHKAMDAYQVQSAAETKLTEIYKTRMGATDGAAKSTMKLASALQKEGVIGDEVTLSGAQQLATFAKYPGTVDQLLPAMGNLLAQQKGLNATSEDAVNIGNLMGKVMQGQTGALKRVGITFDENQEKVLKYGTEEEKAATLAEVITSNVGEMNKTMAQTPEGKIQQMKNSLGDMAEEVGRVLAPALADLAKWVSKKVIPKIEKFFQFMNEHPRIRKVALALVGVAVAIGPLLIGLAGVIKAMSAISGIFKIVAGGPIMWIIAGITALVAGFMYLWKKSKAFRQFWITLWNGIKAVTKAVVGAIVGFFTSAWANIKKAWSTVKSFFSGLWDGIKGVFSGVGHFFKTAFEKGRKNAQANWAKTKGFFKNVWSGIKGAFSNVGSFFKTTFETAQKNAKANWEHTKSFFRNVWSGIKNVFHGVASFFGGVFSRAWSAIKRVFSNVGSFFGGIWSTIKSKFTSLGSTIGGAISKAVRTGINGIIGPAERVINKAIGFINKAIGIINKIPKVNIPKLSKVSFPRLAQGGVLAKGQVGILEGTGAEAVVPLERNKEWIRRVAHDMQYAMGSGAAGGRVVNITVNNNIDGAEKPEEYAARLVRQLKLEMRTI